MTQYAKRALAWVLALALLLTCGISGLVLPASASDGNLFVNGDFEEGPTSKWQSTDAEVVAGVGKGGGYGYYHNRTQTNTNTGTGLMRYKAALLSLMEGGKKYVLTFDYKTSGAAQPQLYLDRRWGTRDDTSTAMSGGIKFASSAEWTTVSIPFTTDDTITTGYGYEFAMRSIGGVGELWYDNICVVPAATSVTATAINLNKTALTLEKGSDETLQVSVSPDGAEMPEITWTSSDAAVATVVNGKVTAVDAGTATITAAAGELTATCVVTVTDSTSPPAQDTDDLMVNGTFDAATSGWKYASTVAGLFNQGDAVPVKTDAAGNKYIEIPANGIVITGPAVTCEVSANDWLQISFKVRKNAAGKMRHAMRVQGMTNGYLQPDWMLSDNATKTSHDGQWMTYTFFAKAEKNTTSIYLQALELAANTTADLPLDLDDVKIKNLGQIADAAVPMFAGGEMNEPAAEFNDYAYGGLFNDGGVIVQDPDDATNNVLKMTAAAQAYFYPCPHSYRDNGTARNVMFQKNTVYKLAYRMKGTGTTSVSATPSYGTVLSVTGAPATASAEWKTVEAYILTTDSPNSNYMFLFRTNGTVYLDDMTLVEVPNADAISLDKTTIVDMKPGDEETLTATVSPVGFPVKWTSDNEAVATVANGTVTAVNEGTAVIAATAGDKTASCTVTVKKPGKATAIVLNKTEISLYSGNSETLTATTEPTASLYDSLSWSTSDAAIATVQDGVVTAGNTQGVATITATAMVDGQPLTATCTVTVVGLATSITATVDELHLAPAVNANLAVTETIDLIVEPAGAYVGTLQWSSNNEAVATVESGKVKAVAEGTAVITVTNGALTDTVTVKVDAAGERISGGDFEGNDWNITQWTTNVIKDGRGTLVADPKNPENTVLSIEAKKTAGWFLWPMVVNPERTYKVTFKALNADGKVMCNYLEPTNSVVDGGWRDKVAAKGEWTEISYTFSTKAAATLNRNYVIAFGNHANSTLYIDDFSVVELPEATGLQLVPSGDLELMPNGSMTLTAASVPAEASLGALTWTSSAPSVISVSNKGEIKALAQSGTAVITVTSAKGLTDSVTVTINEYANLLENGDFEQGATNWKTGSWNLNELILPGIGKDGSYGLKVVNTTGNSRVDSYYNKAIPVQPATTYILTFDYYSTDDSHSFRVYSTTIGVGSKFASNGDGEWKTATHIFTTPADLKLNTTWDLALVCDGQGGEDVVVDNICIKMYDTGVEATKAELNYSKITMIPGRTTALKINPVPTEGDTNRAKWTSSNEDVATVEYGVVTAVGKGTATITAELRNGVKATCEVTVSGDEALVKNGTFTTNNAWATTGASAITEGVGSVAANGTITQTISGLKPETTYQLFVRYRAEASSKIDINLTNSNATVFTTSQSTSTSWVKKTFEFETDAAVESEATLTFTVGSGSGPIFVDHVILAQKASLVDLQVDEVFWDGGNEQVKPGTELLFAVAFSNTGEDAVKAGAVIDIDICVDSEMVQRLTYTVGEQGFASGQTDFIIGTELWAAVEGDHVVSARINSTLSVLEMNTDNNARVQSDLRVAETFIETPEIAENAGFTHLTFSDDFNSLHTIDRYGTGADGYKWYITRPYSVPNVETDDYEINDGVMTLKLKKPNYNYGLGTMDIATGNGYEFKYGYMEFRIRMYDYDSSKEGGPAIWSLPYDKLVNQCDRWVEMDWLEYWGTPSYAKEGRFTVTMHDIPADNTHWYKNGNHAVNGMGDNEWHTMAFLWDYGVVIAYLDGVEVMRQAYDVEDGIFPMASVAKGDDPFPVDAFQPMNDHALPVTICGSFDNRMDIDYIRIWTGSGGGSIPESDKEQEDDGNDDVGNEDIAVDFAAEEFWYNYCTDIYGDLITEVNKDNYLTVLEGALYWELLSAERRAEINALLTENGQPTFEALIAAAQAFENEEVPPDEEKPDEELPDKEDTPAADDEGTKPEDSPETGVGTFVPLALVLAVMALAFMRKRRTVQ